MAVEIFVVLSDPTMNLSETKVIENNCTIGITTKGRSRALADTLRKLGNIGFGGVRYILLDDGSERPEDTRRIAQGLKRCRLIAHNESHGLICSRNEIANCCETPILIVLDDDSYFIDPGRLAANVGAMISEPTLALVSFKIIQSKPHEVLTTDYLAGPLLWFRGCGWMVKVDAFRKVGGFPDVLFYGAEENHLIYQLFKCGYILVHDPTVVVEHQWCPAARDLREMEYHFSRSQAIVKLLNLPAFLAFASIGLQFFRRTLRVSSFRERTWDVHIAGTFHGLHVGLRERRKAKLLTMRESFAFFRMRRSASVPLLRGPQ